MPELPEVETIRQQLDKHLRGKILSTVTVFKSGRERPHGQKFAEAVTGSRIAKVARRAKLLIFHLDDGRAMLGHLKMTGKFLFLPSVSPLSKGESEGVYTPTKHDRMLFVLDSGDRLVWSDVRMFGYLRLVDADGLRQATEIYGPEPLDTSAEELAACLVTPKTRKVKAALLDQEAIAGVGNIYADEACHRAGIRPTRRLGTLTANDRLRLVTEVKKVLAESLAQKGTSANDYVDTDGEKGSFLSFLKVYGRDGQLCQTCEAPIKKIVLGGRGTHYCPICQR